MISANNNDTLRILYRTSYRSATYETFLVYSSLYKEYYTQSCKHDYYYPA